MRLSYLRAVSWLALTTACAFVVEHATAQQTVPFENGNPIAPAGFEPHAIPADPIEYDTAEVMRVRVVPVARGLVNFEVANINSCENDLGGADTVAEDHLEEAARFRSPAAILAGQLAS